MSILVKLEQKKLVVSYKMLAPAVAALILFNIMLYSMILKKDIPSEIPKISNRLYLLDQASNFVYDLDGFETKVREVSSKLNIPPEWLMSVIHSESRFDASVSNYKGSGATGLIQFMPGTAKEFGISVSQLKNLSHVEQMNFVYKYLSAKQAKYGSFETLTDLYIAILYPKALAEDFCYSLYAKPSISYEMNSGLDQNNDGNVTIQDIDKYLKRKYPSAYIISKNGSTVEQPSKMTTGFGGR
ncbi:MAG: transglycosylase SLT domain-containing protein [Sphingobacteriales bacterium]|nr:MAG: transglycosylase SLT domain-containing protein [Sphingobacteriales bacterium]